MERIQRIKYNKELFDKQLYFDKALKFVNEEIKSQQANCSHINVVLGHDKQFIYRKCIFCEKVMAGVREDIPTIDATNYKEELYSTGATQEARTSRLNELRNILVSLVTDKPEITDEEIFNELNQLVKKK